MKALTLIPKKVREMYHIRKSKDCLDIHSPIYVNINFDEKFSIKTSKNSVDIGNDKCIVILFRKTKLMNITIYKS